MLWLELDHVFFIGCFLPVCILLYWLLKSTRLRKALLICASLLFYAFGSLSGLLVLLVAAAINFLLGLAKPGKLLCGVGIAANLALLGAYKYLSFLTGGAVAAQNLVAPIGISFFIFKSISYLIDTCRQKAPATRNAGDFLLYLSFFPHVVSGPIIRFGDFQHQLAEPEKAELPAGLRRFVVGLAKKLLLSGTLGKLVDTAFAAASPSLPLAWLGALAYMLQIYFDFSGYSDMSIGLGGIFGIPGMENFHYPYAATTITDFWRRWHISLSSWFRDYLYIPLGGNRRSKLRAAVNKIIVFTLCGLWHGANWTFVIWGLWHGLFAALETFRPLRPQKTAFKLLCRIYTLLVVLLGFVMFRAGSVSAGLSMLWAMFGGSLHGISGLLNAETLSFLVLGVLACLPWQVWLTKKPKLSRLWDSVSYPVCLVLFVLCLLRLATGGFTPSIYGQF